MKSEISSLVRPNILEMTGYKSARDEYTNTTGTFLDANESPYGKMNRYPDPYQNNLKCSIAKLKAIDTSEIFIGNGSDEIIDLLYRTFCIPGKDMSLSFSPGYSMYEVSASIQDIKHRSLNLNIDFQINRSSLEPYLTRPDLKLLFICSPNNPTGNTIHAQDIEWILEMYKGILIIDEAYIDFAQSESWISKLKKYENLVILQTMSKAWSLAGARVGMAYTHPTIVNLLNKVKAPYNVSTLNQQAANEILNDSQTIYLQSKSIVSERERIYEIFKSKKWIKKAYPSEANFILVEVDNASKAYNWLIKKRIVVRNQSSKIDNCLRLTIGTPEENKILLNALSEYYTQKTSISEYGLDGSPDLINRH